MPDGTIKDRVEQIQKPNISVIQLFKDTLGLDNEKTNVTVNIVNNGFTTL